MHIVIMGCGRVGSRLALTLEARGHEVAVIETVSRYRQVPAHGGSFSREGWPLQ